ncbi:hypothetical protein LguiB_007738 [Lonicera macranthoides]
MCGNISQVKYEETLRRFNARVSNEELDLDMDGLRDQVHRLFHFAPNADIILTYIDEDGDVVTLSDDEDLRDVMRQSLNPLRITVKLNTEKSDDWYARSSGSSTPIKSPRVQHPLNTSVYEIFKSVPGPLCEAVSKLPTILVSNPTSPQPVVAEVVDILSRMGLTYLRQILEVQPGTGSRIHSGAQGVPVDASGVKDEKSPNVEGQTSKKLASANSEVPNEKSNELDHGKKCAETSNLPTTGSVNLNVSPSLHDNKEQVKKLGEGPSSGKSDKNKEVTKRLLRRVGLSTTPEPCSRAASRNASRSHIVPNLNECPFSGSLLEHGGIINVFHRGVRCDGCGVHPITGLRFKSKVKEDYDLCSICFAAMGNEADYIRMDRPAIHRQSFKGLDASDSRVLPPKLPADVVRGSGMKPSQPKLDSRFVQDVNIVDGTIMAPSTPFTKIWRMKNNGTIMWPRGTQLLWIGGDRLSVTPYVDLEIPADGFPVDKEVDIAVNFSAPELPGRYISYWRMVSPSGQKFGQRVWVLIQVYASLKNTWGESPRGINLNLPPINSGITGLQHINLNEPYNSDRVTELVQPIADMHSNKDLELNFPINDTLLVGEASREASSLIPCPIIDNSDLARSTAIDGKSADGEVNGNNNVEQSHLRELEEMGFKQVDLNKEILRMNEYNLEQSVEDLCDVAEWDPILEELKEMGFCDDETNKRLLKKNNGSIKRVVMDLLAGEKP